MSKLSRVIFAAVFAAGMSLSACADVVVDDVLPAGNIVFEKIDGDTVSVHQELRDTEGAWFYWAMRVTGAAGRTLTFNFTTSDAVGVRGAVVSTDGGKTFSYAGTNISRRHFTYTFGAEENETWFYECIPYMPADWAAFLATHDDVKGSYFMTDVLCQSSKTSADVPMARFGCLTGTPKYRIVLSSRHHCSETVATYVVEGFAAAFLKDDDLGAWLRGNVLLTVVPFVDYDGVVAGDQGKNRKPSGSASACDHNRDYSNDMSQSHYTETRALAALVAFENPDAWFDIHCPSLSGGCNETLYTPGKESTLRNNDLTREARFSALLQSLQCGSMGYKASDDIPYGTSWNTGSNYSAGMSCIIWALQNENLTNLKVCRTFEVPFANANGYIVTETTCRDLGADIAKTTKAFLLELESTPPSADPETKDYTKLPDDYTEVEYVQAAHEQYIDTDYKPNAKTTIYLKFAADDYKATREDGTSTALKDRSNVYILACYDDRCQFAYGNTWFLGFGKDDGTETLAYDNTGGASKDTDIHAMGLTNGTFYIDGAKKFESPRKTSFTRGDKQSTLSVFALHQKDDSKNIYKFWCAAKVYSLIISEDGVEKRHYIPAVDAEGKVGLYDTVTGGFYKSATTTALVAGPTVGPVNDDPKFSGFSVGSDLNRAWEQVTVTDGTNYDVSVEAYMGTDTATWSAVSSWTHSVFSATYAATNSNVSAGQTYYCAFKLTYEKNSETIVKWTSTNSTTISGTVHWSGNGADTKWTTAGNWQEGLVPNAALTTHFAKDRLIYVTAGEEALASKGVYVTQGTTVWDFQPETTLAMTYLHVGEKDKTTANLIVTNGVINSTGSVAFDYSNGSLQLSGTKATYGVKLYQTKVGNTTLKLTDGASLKMPAYDSAGDASGGDTFFIGEGSSLLFTGGSDYSTPSTIPKNSTITIDGGAWTNYNQQSFATDANSTGRIIVKNGGVYSHRPSNKLSSTKKPLSLGGRGHTYITVTDGGVFEDLYELRFGDATDAYAGSSEIAITNGTLKCAGAITIGRDSRCKTNYKVTVAGEDGLLEAKGGLTLGSTSYAGGTERTGGSAMLLVDGGTVNVTGALNVGAEHERVTDTLKVLGSTAKVTAGSIACTTNAVVKFVVPANGFANGFEDAVVDVAGDIDLSSADGWPTPVEIDATTCASSAWQTLMRAGGAISNLDESQVSVSVASGKNYELNLEKDGDQTKSLKLRIFSAAPRGTVIIYR